MMVPSSNQDVIRISHREFVADLIEGRDLEKIVLARGVRLHLNFESPVCREKQLYLIRNGR